VFLDAAVGVAVFLIAEVAAGDGGAERFGDLDGEGEMLSARAVRGLPGVGAFTHAAGADVDLQIRRGLPAL
jgi:hypothetical protein